MANALAIVTTDFAMPAILAAASPKARTRVLEFFGASIRNEEHAQGVHGRLRRVDYPSDLKAIIDEIGATALQNAVFPVEPSEMLEAAQCQGHALRGVATLDDPLILEFCLVERRRFCLLALEEQSHLSFAKQRCWASRHRATPPRRKS
jgi:hypothetical protein